MAENFDAVVIGGGPGGSTAALMLARAGWSVAVIEKLRFPRRKVCGEYLSPASLALFGKLGIADEFLKLAGPPVRQIGLFARDTILVSDMPGPSQLLNDSGRALGRERLDALLLNRATEAGASVWQPWSATKLDRREDGFVCTATNKETGQMQDFRTRVAIAAHGAWETGPLPTQSGRPAPRLSTLFGFKAHFQRSRLPLGLMPLLAFPGGYGGMVHSDSGRVSLSCCIRRDALQQCRRATGEAVAAAAVLAHLKRSCRGVQQTLEEAQTDGAWLSAGPICPGIRQPFAQGVFCVGNAAGEAHPIIADGISMAIEAAWFLGDRLAAVRTRELTSTRLDAMGREYAAVWKKTFGPRIRVAALFAHLAMRPSSVAVLLPAFRRVPAILTFCARLSGKTNEAVASVLSAARATGTG